MDALSGPGQPGSSGPYYQIRVRGQIDPRWADWFGGLAITHEGSGETLLSGHLADQAALYGVLSKARDLGLELLAVSRHAPPPPVEANDGAGPPT